MTSTNDPGEKFVGNLNESIQQRWVTYKWLLVVQWTIMILVGIAGVFTTFSGLVGDLKAGQQPPWYAQGSVLLVWGIVTTIGAIVNQTLNPAKKAEHNLKVKVVYKAIRGAIQFRGMPLDEAEKIRASAWGNPEHAMDQISGWSAPVV